MMNHRTIRGFRHDEAMRNRHMNRTTMRRVLTFMRGYRTPLIGYFNAVVLDS
jgi:hypothetical protein